jgi:hypothetical protein
LRQLYSLALQLLLHGRRRLAGRGGVVWGATVHGGGSHGGVIGEQAGLGNDVDTRVGNVRFLRNQFLSRKYNVHPYVHTKVGNYLP